MNIGFVGFLACNGDDPATITGGLFKVFQTQEIESGHRGVEVRMQGVTPSGLTVAQPGELFSVAEWEPSLNRMMLL